MIVVALGARTPNAVRPWSEAGYECWCVDIQHSIRRERIEGNIHFVWGDFRSWCPPEGRRIAFLFAFPPCTHLAVSGARDFRSKGGWMLADALQAFDSCQMAAAYAGCPYLIENPVSRLSTHRRAPDHTFDPCDFAGYADDPDAEAFTKKTCLWTGGGFVMPNPRPVEPTLGSLMHRLPPSRDRADVRSVTPIGFARAVFQANHEKTEGPCSG